MFHEAMRAVNEAEAKAKALRQTATEAAEDALATAEAQGAASVQAAIETGEAECAELLRQAEEDALRQATKLAANTENKKAALGARVETTRGKAVDFIMGRIVGQ
ncbi:MAG: hypothetical protein FWE28_08030 [Oscillospiraceae bacterium]|nr:hypothetical protein [Oscillospiraceae bacterium]